MLRKKQVALIAVVAAVALPASAHAARITGVVIAKDPKRGSLVLAGRSGVGTTVRAPRAHARLGDRLLVSGPRLADGTMRAGSVRVVGHLRRATVRAVVVRQLSRRTLVSTGGSIISIRRASSARLLSMAGDHSGLKPGVVARFGLAISANGVSQTAATPLGVTTNVRVEGHLVSVSPFVVSFKGLPLTITVPAGITLPTGLMPRMHVELTVSVGEANALTLVSIDDQPQAGEDDQIAGDDDQNAADDDQAEDEDEDQGDEDDQDDQDHHDHQNEHGDSGSSGSSGHGDSGSGGGGDD